MDTVSRPVVATHSGRIAEGSRTQGPVVKGLKGPALPTPVLAPWSFDGWLCMALHGFAGPRNISIHRSSRAVTS